MNTTLKRGFTLVELLIVIIIIAVLAAIAIPKFANSSTRSKEGSLKADLKIARDAVDLFKSDTGLYPSALTDLAATAAPAKGLDASATSLAISATDWKGPYVASVPNDPVSGLALKYSTAAGTVGNVNASAAGSDSAGVLFSTY